MAVAVALVMCGFTTAPADRVGRVSATPIGEYRNHGHVATVNIRGGRKPDGTDANAKHWYNDDVTRIGLDNTLQSRTLARGAHLHGLAVQEVCRNHWLDAVFELEVWGAIDSSNPWALIEAVRPTITGGLAPGCGSWFGVASLVRGSWAATAQGFYDDQQSEQRAWLCVRTYLTFCNTHLSRTDPERGAQLTDLRAIATFTSALTPSVSLFAAGDLNTTPTAYGDLWRVGWAYDGFTEADLANPQATTDSGSTLDYIWRTRPNTWAYDAYISPWAHTDHHWKQGYM